MFDPAAITHYALAVADLEAAMADLGAQLGLTWASVQEWEMRIIERGQPVETPIRLTYSLEGPPHLELVEGEEGTVWAAQAGIHHVGVWTDDLGADADALAAAGMPVEAAGRSRSGRSPVGFTYHTGPHGLRLELVDIAAMPRFERWLAGGNFE